MELPEAIRILRETTLKQGTRMLKSQDREGVEHYCAMGVLNHAMKRVQDYGLQVALPAEVICPLCQSISSHLMAPIGPMHLNDYHHFSFTQIADCLEGIYIPEDEVKRA